MEKWKLYIIMLLIMIFSVSAVNTDDLVIMFAENSSGSTNATAISTYQITPPTGETWIISRMIVHITDTGSFDAGKYGNNIDLTNGIVIQTNISGTLQNLTNGRPILTNQDWGAFSYDIAIDDFGLGTDSLSVRWTFSKSGTFIELKEGDHINVFIQDDLTNLDDHTFMFQGYKKQTGDASLIYLGIMLVFMFFIGLLVFAFVKSENISYKTLSILAISILVMSLTRFMSWFISIENPAETELINTLDHFFMFGVWGFRFVLIGSIAVLLISILNIFKFKKDKKKNNWEDWGNE